MDLAPIGNGRISALINSTGSIDWWCFPRFDGDPVFCRLLSGAYEKGFCDVQLGNLARSTSCYLRNTPIVQTDLEDTVGNIVRISDFAPRFQRFGRMFHPAQIVRHIVPLRGIPQVTLRVRPTFNYGEPAGRLAIGSNHVTYSGGGHYLRLTTDAPLSYIVDEAPFVLTRSVSMIFGPDEPLDGAVDEVASRFLERTHDHWSGWIRGLGIPYEWQPQVIRAAITLKLCSFEETGAIIAAHTTSIPESAGSHRTWDYRYCWLRDAYFVIQALNRLGATHTMEAYVNYIANVAINSENGLKPVYGIVHTSSLDERIVSNLDGFKGMGPVRVGNAAAYQLQHDAYGSVVLGVSNMFIDQRLPRIGDAALFARLERLGEQARKFAFCADAGLWEYRGRQRVHTHSATMCWVACDRLARIAAILNLPSRHEYWRQIADKLRHHILDRAWSAKRGAFAGALDDHELDASVLLLPKLGLLPHTDDRYKATCDVIGRELARNGYIMRYTTPDDFGEPETAFLICQFWYIDALAAIGKTTEARDRFVDILTKCNSYGILSEDIHPHTGVLWGNIPQTYSMAGIINSGISLSRTWDECWEATDITEQDGIQKV